MYKSHITVSRVFHSQKHTKGGKKLRRGHQLQLHSHFKSTAGQPTTDFPHSEMICQCHLHFLNPKLI